MEEKKILNKLKQRDIVELIYIPPKGKKLTLIFDKRVYLNDYGVDYTQWIFQKNPEDIGNLKTAIVYTDAYNLKHKEIKIETVNGMSVKEFEKTLKSKTKKKEFKPFESINKFEINENENENEEFKTYENSGFIITEREKRFYCPCGNSYTKKENAVWAHKRHIGMK